jgi:hypothetical protein
VITGLFVGASALVLLLASARNDRNQNAREEQQ